MPPKKEKESSSFVQRWTKKFENLNVTIGTSRHRRRGGRSALRDLPQWSAIEEATKHGDELKPFEVLEIPFPPTLVGNVGLKSARHFAMSLRRLIDNMQGKSDAIDVHVFTGQDGGVYVEVAGKSNSVA